LWKLLDVIVDRGAALAAKYSVHELVGVVNRYR